MHFILRYLLKHLIHETRCRSFLDATSDKRSRPCGKTPTYDITAPDIALVKHMTKQRKSPSHVKKQLRYIYLMCNRLQVAPVQNAREALHASRFATDVYFIFGPFGKSWRIFLGSCIFARWSAAAKPNAKYVNFRCYHALCVVALCLSPISRSGLEMRHATSTKDPDNQQGTQRIRTGPKYDT